MGHRYLHALLTFHLARTNTNKSEGHTYMEKGAQQCSVGLFGTVSYSYRACILNLHASRFTVPCNKHIPSYTLTILPEIRQNSPSEM